VGGVVFRGSGQGRIRSCNKEIRGESSILREIKLWMGM